MNIYYQFLFLLVTIANSCSTTSKIKCPNGEIVIIDSKNDLLFLNTTRENLYEITSELLSNTSVSFENKKEVEQVVQRLDSYNTSYYLTILAADKHLTRFPCDTNARKDYSKAMSEARTFLNKLQLAVIEKGKSLVADSGLSGSAIDNYIYVMKNFIKSIQN